MELDDDNPWSYNPHINKYFYMVGNNSPSCPRIYGGAYSPEFIENTFKENIRIMNCKDPDIIVENDYELISPDLITRFNEILRNDDNIDFLNSDHELDIDLEREEEAEINKDRCDFYIKNNENIDSDNNDIENENIYGIKYIYEFDSETHTNRIMHPLRKNFISHVFESFVRGNEVSTTCYEEYNDLYEYINTILGSFKVDSLYVCTFNLQKPPRYSQDMWDSVLTIPRSLDSRFVTLKITNEYCNTIYYLSIELIDNKFIIRVADDIELVTYIFNYVYYYTNPIVSNVSFNTTLGYNKDPYLVELCSTYDILLENYNKFILESMKIHMTPEELFSQ